jgi:hypothetical protein
MWFQARDVARVHDDLHDVLVEARAPARTVAVRLAGWSGLGVNRRSLGEGS